MLKPVTIANIPKPSCSNVLEKTRPPVALKSCDRKQTERAILRRPNSFVNVPQGPF